MKVEISVDGARTLDMHEQALFHAAVVHRNTHAAWRSLDRIHILSQEFGLMHLASHWRMLRFAWSLRDSREVLGQLTRLALAPIGNITSKLLFGNTGRANVSTFQPMDIPPDLKAQIAKL